MNRTIKLFAAMARAGSGRTSAVFARSPTKPRPFFGRRARRSEETSADREGEDAEEGKKMLFEPAMIEVKRGEQIRFVL